MCPEKYVSQSGGFKCHPIIVKVTHKFDITYTCYGWSLVHTEKGPVVYSPTCTNCKLVSTQKKDKGHVRTTTFWLALSIGESSDCNTSSHTNAKAVFMIYPPTREWNGGGRPGPKPYTTWDSGNPYFDVKADVTYDSKHDSDKYVYNRTSNPHPNSDFSVPSEQTRYLIVKIDDGELSVHIKRNNDG